LQVISPRSPERAAPARAHQPAQRDEQAQDTSGKPDRGRAPERRTGCSRPRAARWSRARRPPPARQSRRLKCRVGPRRRRQHQTQLAPASAPGRRSSARRHGHVVRNRYARSSRRTPERGCASGCRSARRAGDPIHDGHQRGIAFQLRMRSKESDNRTVHVAVDRTECTPRHGPRPDGMSRMADDPSGRLARMPPSPPSDPLRPSSPPRGCDRRGPRGRSAVGHGRPAQRQVCRPLRRSGRPTVGRVSRSRSGDPPGRGSGAARSRA